MHYLFLFFGRDGRLLSGREIPAHLHNPINNLIRKSFIPAGRTRTRTPTPPPSGPSSSNEDSAWTVTAMDSVNASLPSAPAHSKYILVAFDLSQSVSRSTLMDQE